jgi:hypothetical protein
MYNQHFTKKNIEAAVRTALTNNDEVIFVNGPRSKNRYSITYNKVRNTLYLVGAKNASVNVEELTKRQTKKDGAVAIIVEHFANCIAA